MLRQIYQFIRLFLRRSLGYSSTEARAFIVLNILIIVVLLLPWFIENHYASRKWLNDNDLDKLDSLIERLATNAKPSNHIINPSLIKLSSINPNLIHLDTLIMSGLNQRAAENLVRYREKGGTFRSVDDVYKIYGMDTTWLLQHANVFDFSNHLVDNNTIDPKDGRNVLKDVENVDSDLTINNQKNHSIEKIDINKADAETLKKLPGIGDILSERIVKYRNLTGGFVNAGQLVEVYGIDEETVARMLSVIYVESEFKPRKINLNTAPLYYMKRHPYINEKLALQIDSLRKITKPLDSIQVVEIIISSETEKVLPYIGF